MPTANWLYTLWIFASDLFISHIGKKGFLKEKASQTA
jgi:hypothetical protein